MCLVAIRIAIDFIRENDVNWKRISGIVPITTTATTTIVIKMTKESNCRTIYFV